MNVLIIANISIEGKIKEITVTPESKGFSLSVEVKAEEYHISWSTKNLPKFQALFVQNHDSPRPLFSQSKTEFIEGDNICKHIVSFSNGNIKRLSSFYLLIALGIWKPLIPVYNKVRL
jgi:hypothetical protein